MKKWILTASTDGVMIDFELIIESNTEPGFWECYEIAQENNCDFFSINEFEEV